MYDFFWKAFPSELAHIRDALPLALEFYRGNPVADEDLDLAIFNCAGFARQMIRGQPDGPPIFGTTSATTAEVEAAFAEAIEAANHPVKMSASPMGSAWLTILLPILIELIKRRLSR